MMLRIRRRRRLRSPLRYPLVAALVCGAVVVRSGLDAGADAPADDPYAVVLAIDTNRAPDVFETTIVARPAARDLGNGLTADMWTFNGTVPGPEIRVRVGDTVIVHYRNELPLPSAIHWHGIELNNASDGTELTQNTVSPGESFLYQFIVPRPGVFWYHPHHHPTNQVFRGLYGSLIVTDGADDTLVARGVLPSREDTRTLMLSDTTVCKEPGHNDTDTYDDSLPWAGGGPLPEQPAPFPDDLCDRPIDDHGNPIVDGDGRRVPLRAGAIPNIQRVPPPFGSGPRVVNEGQTVLANGRNPGGRNGSPEAPGALHDGATTFDVAAGQGLRLQAINAATVRYFRLRLTDSAGRRIPLVRIGGEGGLLDAARIEGNQPEAVAPGFVAFDHEYERGEIVLGPSDRADVVVVVPVDAAPGPATLWTLDFTRTGTDGWSRIPTVPVAHLNVTAPTGEAYTLPEGARLRTHPAVADPVEALGPPPGPLPDLSGAISPLLDPATFSPRKEGTANEDIRITTSAERTSIDNVVGTHNPSIDYTAAPRTRSSRYARLGDLLELTVTNMTTAHHPFHLHGFSFQPLAFERIAVSTSPKPTYTFDYHEFVDTIDLPAQYTFRFRVRLDDRPQMDGKTPGGGLGRWVLHCHIFFHATLGMHSELVVLAPDGNEKPYVNADNPLIDVAQGGTASTTGTFVDPDGDPVTLSASTGTVTDRGNGRWSWSLASQDQPVGSRTVHVTATDPRGQTGQAAFDLDIDNVAPVVTVTSPPSGSSFPAGSTVTVDASITDPGTSPLSCRFDWDDGGGAGPPVVAVAGRCSDTRTLTRAGVHTVVVTASDGEGATGSDATTVVVYDPGGGFVTGSGTTGGGEAGFDVSARYHKGAPVGRVLFTHPATGFDFAATGFDWLVVAGDRAQARGSGVVGGIGGHRFLLTVVDGVPDRLRLKVWDEGTGRVVYDNAAGRPDDIDTADPPPISGGSIVVHKA